MEDIVLIEETKKNVIEEVYEWLKGYAWVKENNTVDYPILLHDFFKDFRKYM